MSHYQSQWTKMKEKILTALWTKPFSRRKEMLHAYFLGINISFIFMLSMFSFSMANCLKVACWLFQSAIVGHVSHLHMFLPPKYSIYGLFYFSRRAFSRRGPFLDTAEAEWELTCIEHLTDKISVINDSKHEKELRVVMGERVDGTTMRSLSHCIKPQILIWLLRRLFEGLVLSFLSMQ